MNQFRSVFIALFITGFVLFLYQYLVVDIFYGVHFRVGSIQLKNASEGFQLASDWNSQSAGDYSLLHYAKLNTWIDFIWIAGYAGVLVNLAYTSMQRENSALFNELLRWCFILSVLAGLLDIIENIILLFDFSHLTTEDHFYSSAWVSYPKWILVIIVVAIIVVSFIRRKLLKA